MQRGHKRRDLLPHAPAPTRYDRAGNVRAACETTARRPIIFAPESSYHGLPIDGSVSYQHFKYTSINPLSGIKLGYAEPGFQPDKFSIGAQYEAHIPSGGSITPRLDYIYESGYQGIIIPDPFSYVVGYHELNGRITYRPEAGKWEASVVGTNLTNKLWYISSFDLYNQSGADYGTPSAPRTIWAEFKKRF